MRSVPAPPRNLVLADTVFSEKTLRVSHSNQGDPYRETLVLTFEMNAHGNYDRYEHIASVELSGEEEQQLRDLLNERASR